MSECFELADGAQQITPPSINVLVSEIRSRSGLLRPVLSSQTLSSLVAVKKRLQSDIGLPAQSCRARTSTFAGIALEHNTRRGYAAGARDYGRFCYDYGLPLDPTVDTLADYIAYTSTFVKVKTGKGQTLMAGERSDRPS